MDDVFEEKSIILYPSEGKKRKCVKLICSTCGEYFWRDIRKYKQHKGNKYYCSDECRYGTNRIEVVCKYCGIKHTKKKSQLVNSKSGLYFCCREHKDLAQRIENNIPEIWADHYGNAKATYRDVAFRNYGGSCEHCGYDVLDICEVHHIDRDRNNNTPSNLIVLCPNCHTSVHKGFLIIENRKLIKNNS